MLNPCSLLIFSKKSACVQMHNGKSVITEWFSAPLSLPSFYCLPHAKGKFTLYFKNVNF